MIKKRFIVGLLAVLGLLNFAPSSAATFGLDPSSTTFAALDTVSVDLTVSGLASDEVITAFDVFIDHSLSLALDDVVFSNALGDELLGDSLPLFFDLFGTVEVLNISLLFDTNDLTPLQTNDPLLLATLSFTALDAGESDFVISNSIVGIEPVPLPGAVWLMISGLLGIGAMARKRATAA